MVPIIYFNDCTMQIDQARPLTPQILSYGILITCTAALLMAVSQLAFACISTCLLLYFTILIESQHPIKLIRFFSIWDLGKMKYGGPFTTEEVEDTKTFLRIVLLLASLVGSLSKELFIIEEPLHITTLTIIVGVPLFLCFEHAVSISDNSILSSRSTEKVALQL